jgi:uncharacterized protein (DUF433 family)
MDLPEFLSKWPDGEIVLTDHRIGLFSVIDLVERGFSPDEIRNEYPTLEPELIRSVLAFYEGHRAEVDCYVAEFRADLDHQEFAGQSSPAVLRIRRLIAERAANGPDSDGP